MARLGLIGDVHAEDHLLERAIVELRGRGADVILCVGDIADGAGDLARSCDLLARHDVLTVRGNHDRWLVTDLAQDPSDPRTRARLPGGMLAHLLKLRESTPPSVAAYLSSLPATRALSTARGPALLCHGLGGNDMAFVGPEEDPRAHAENMELRELQQSPDVQIVFNGHTHRRGVRHFEGLTIINAGTLARQHDPGAVLVDLSSGEVSWLGFAEGPRTEMTILGAAPSRP